MASKDGHWIEHAGIKAGGLHKALNVAAGKKIPAAKLASARNSDNPRVRRMATLADTFRKMRD